MNKIDMIEKKIINGREQYFSIRSQNLQNPILLYLHGGPGDACIPLMTKYNRSWEQHFTVVILEQRGAGLSYYKFNETDNLNIQTFVDDIHALSLYLLDRFQKEQLYLVGHSWGSVLGLKFILTYPHLVKKYIGCGQVVNMEKTLEEQIIFILKNANDRKIYQRIESIDVSLEQESWLNDILYIAKQVVKLGGSIHGKTNQNSLIFPFLTSKEYSLFTLIRRQKGSLQGLRYFWKELMTVNFETITSFEVPVVFMEGRHDYHASSKVVEAYYQSITSPKELIWFEDSAHFPQWEEAEKLNALIAQMI